MLVSTTEDAGVHRGIQFLSEMRIGFFKRKSLRNVLAEEMTMGMLLNSKAEK